MSIDLFTSEDRYLPRITTAPVFTIATTLGIAHVRYTREAPLTQSATWVSDHRYSTALDSLTVPPTPYVFNNCIYF